MTEPKEYEATLIDRGNGDGYLIVHCKQMEVLFKVKAFPDMSMELERPAEHLDHLICPHCLNEFYTSKKIWKEGDEK